MITIEIDNQSEEIFIHADPLDLRELAKKLWAISEKADVKGKHKEQLSTGTGSDLELSAKPRQHAQNRRAIKKLTLSSSVS